MKAAIRGLLSCFVRRNSRIGQSGLLCSLSERLRREPSVQVSEEFFSPVTILSKAALVVKRVTTNTWRKLVYK